ncbi:MAG TPA: YggT family protein [Candidatus Acidoferrum sp.]|nr:YggT family protein [Candidatus Acidoferrum sp.]
MFVASNFILAIARLLEIVLWAYFWILIARAVLSWVNPDPYNPIVRFLIRVTEPVLRPIRDRLPTMAMGLDLSPMIVMLAIYFLESFLVGSLRDLALSLR